ncbi:hypothetical protein H4R18_002060 [Coemansia javaensis]|uniref:Uncharacterized protein n=1 Tax=Coemansia javaensis TaxID=2761396 RepID=A0A9W8LKL2_9FUNG|nr:hypothetical protein H4R18_002060 [Coemansia javaensis]
MRLAGIVLSAVAAAPWTLAAVTTGTRGGPAAPADASTARVQWPWQSQSQSKVDIPVPGTTFDPDVSSMSPRCLWAGWTAGRRFNTTCFQSNKSLYFSAPSQICSPACLDTTVELAQYMVSRCSLDSGVKSGDPVGYTHKNVVYLSWADRDLANLVCNGPADKSADGGRWADPGRCYSAVFSAEAVRESGQIAGSMGEDRSIMCNECTHQWVKAIKNSKFQISPLLYYGHISDAPRLASWISEQCGYRLTPI